MSKTLVYGYFKKFGFPFSICVINVCFSRGSTSLIILLIILLFLIAVDFKYNNLLFILRHSARHVVYLIKKNATISKHFL